MYGLALHGSHLSLGESEPHDLSFVNEEESAFKLTGRTGSLMYMAPEVFKALPYSEKVRRTI